MKKHRHVSLIKQVVVSKEIAQKHNKFQLWLAKVFKLDLAETHKYLFRIQYKGNIKLQLDDIVMNNQGSVFIVLKTLNRMAMIASKDATSQVPLMLGKLQLLRRKGESKTNK